MNKKAIPKKRKKNLQRASAKSKTPDKKNRLIEQPEVLEKVGEEFQATSQLVFQELIVLIKFAYQHRELLLEKQISCEKESSGYLKEVNQTIKIILAILDRIVNLTKSNPGEKPSSRGSLTLEERKRLESIPIEELETWALERRLEE